ncbi:hypothetical protein [Cellulomonas bogoriensis]|uniref:hypothetical protein n=1 Tax=Cellulomonas bogoriensis TaxID=301388 RepID=UPI000A9A3953|nr:hypothetical protein [Cellulomonas bogoriensis]
MRPAGSAARSPCSWPNAGKGVPLGVLVLNAGAMAAVMPDRAKAATHGKMAEPNHD